MTLAGVCRVLLGFTVTLQPHCAPRCPPARPLRASLPACGHLFTSSSAGRHDGNPLAPTPTLWPGRPSPPWPPLSSPAGPLSCFSPQTPAANHSCLPCSPPHVALSYHRPAQSVVSNRPRRCWLTYKFKCGGWDERVFRVEMKPCCSWTTEN